MLSLVSAIRSPHPLVHDHPSLTGLSSPPYSPWLQFVNVLGLHLLPLFSYIRSTSIIFVTSTTVFSTFIKCVTVLFLTLHTGNINRQQFISVDSKTSQAVVCSLSYILLIIVLLIIVFILITTFLLHKMEFNIPVVHRELQVFFLLDDPSSSILLLNKGTIHLFNQISI